MSVETLILLALGLPLLGGVGVVAFGRLPNLREAATLIAALATFACVVPIVIAVGQGARPVVEIAQIAPGLDLGFRVEPLGAMFAAIASGLWILNSLYSIGYMRGNHEKDQTRFYLCFTIAISAALGIAFAKNLFTLFIFYEVLTLSTYPLVAHKGDAKARKGARIYLLILLATSIGLLLPAIVSTAVVTGTTEFTPGGIIPMTVAPMVGGAILFAFAFGIGKAALMPVHPWLPNAMVAPTPVSALLHAVAVVKAGVFTMLKVAVYIFGADTLQVLPAADVLAGIAAISIVLASIIAITKDNLKARLAFSTVGQLSYVTLGAMLASPIAWMGAALQILMHAFGKITLFMTAGAIYTASKKTEISTMRGMGRQMPLIFLAYTIGALSLIGLPPLAGAWPKINLMLGSADAGLFVLVIALIASSILNVAYLLPLSVRGFFGFSPDGPLKKPTPVFAVAVPVVTALACVILFFAVGYVMDYLAPVFDPAQAGGW